MRDWKFLCVSIFTLSTRIILCCGQQSWLRGENSGQTHQSVLQMQAPFSAFSHAASETIATTDDIFTSLSGGFLFYNFYLNSSTCSSTKLMSSQIIPIGACIYDGNAVPSVGAYAKYGTPFVLSSPRKLLQVTVTYYSDRQCLNSTSAFGLPLPFDCRGGTNTHWYRTYSSQYTYFDKWPIGIAGQWGGMFIGSYSSQAECQDSHVYSPLFPPPRGLKYLNTYSCFTMEGINGQDYYCNGSTAYYTTFSNRECGGIGTPNKYLPMGCTNNAQSGLVTGVACYHTTQSPTLYPTEAPVAPIPLLSGYKKIAVIAAGTFIATLGCLVLWGFLRRNALVRKDHRKRKHLTDDERNQIELVFNKFDVDGSGSIDLKELKLAMKQMGVQTRKGEMKRMMKEVDEDGSGEIDLEEFVLLMSYYM